MITNLQMAKWRQICEKATPPPWHYYPCGDKSNDCILGVACGEDGSPESGPVDLHPYNEETRDYEMHKYIFDPEIASRETDANYRDFHFMAIAREALPVLLDEVEQLKKQACHVFRVRNSKKPEDATDYGFCYSFYDHFDVHWDSGLPSYMDIAELSVFGIFKAAEEA